MFKSFFHLEVHSGNILSVTFVYIFGIEVILKIKASYKFPKKCNIGPNILCIVNDYKSHSTF